jgi:hypothetical protein
MIDVLTQRLRLHWLSAGGLALALAACGGGDGATGASAAGDAARATVQQVQLEVGPLENKGAPVAANEDSGPVLTRSLAQAVDDRPPPRVIVLPELTAAEMPPQTESDPLQIGVGRPVPQAADAKAMADLLSWSTAADGSRRAAISVRSPGAAALRLGLRVEQLPQSAMLRVYAPGAAQTEEITGAEVLRTIQTNLDASDSSMDAHTYWLPSVEGDQAVLEIDLPAGVDPASLKVSLPRISHRWFALGGAALNASQPSCSMPYKKHRGQQMPTDASPLFFNRGIRTIEVLPQRLRLHRLSVNRSALAACDGGGGGAGAPSVSAGAPVAAPVTANDDSGPIRTVSLAQGAGERPVPRAIVLPELTAAEMPPQTPSEPLQIGVERAVPQAADAKAMAGLLLWITAANGSRRAAISVRSPGAAALRLGLLVEQLPQSALLRVYAPGAAQASEVAGTEVLSAIQRILGAGGSGEQAHTYWLPSVEGDQAVLEIELPAGADPASLKVSLPGVLHRWW